ncbi:MAG: hypothetical protein AAB299_07865, partial [Thermodesulfobacteriota bacterium]
VELPQLNKEIKKGEPLLAIRQNSRTISISSPISGKVTLLNAEHIEHPELIGLIPFDLSWMCCIEPTNLAEELHALKIGVDSVNWYKEEIEKYTQIVSGAEKRSPQMGSSGKGNDQAGKQKAEEMMLEDFAQAFLLR